METPRWSTDVGKLSAQKYFPHRLIQSAIDGYNVCIFAYGQTGSGKTFTMVGDKEQKNPGIMPRSFNAIFDIIQENSSKFDFKVRTSHYPPPLVFLPLIHVLCDSPSGFSLYARAVQWQAAGPLCEPGWWGPCTAPVPWASQAGGDQEEQKGGCICPRSRDKGGFQCPGAVCSVPAGLRQPTHLCHQWVLCVVMCRAAQFKQCPAKWFGLIALVAVSMMARYIITGLERWVAEQPKFGSATLFYRCIQVIWIQDALNYNISINNYKHTVVHSRYCKPCILCSLRKDWWWEIKFSIILMLF